MSKLQDKNLLFYSIHPSDRYSSDFLQELNKNVNLKRQFVLVCVNDPKIRIPEKIKQLNKVPVLIAAGFSRPILGPDAVSWLKNGGFQGKANGFEYGTLDDDNHDFAYLAEEYQKSGYNQFYNDDYNLGFTDKDSIINQQFANLSTNSHITTYDDSNEMKKDIASQLDQRLDKLRMQRQTEVPGPMKRIGGLDNMTGPDGQGGQGQGGRGGQGQGGQPNFLNGNRPGNGTGLTYNPNPFASQQTQPQQSGQPQLPFQMPNMGGQLPFQMPMNQPQLPFQMPNMQQQMPNMGHTAQAPRLPFQM